MTHKTLSKKKKKKKKKKREREFQTNCIPKTGNFYRLQNIYKFKEIKIAVETPKSEYIEIPNPIDLKFRLLIAGPSCPTNRLSKLIDILLQLFL